MTRLPGINYFTLEELVDKPIFEAFGLRAMWFLRYELVAAVDDLRAECGRIVVNNWHIGGAFHESGLRMMTTATGAKFSQHKFGNAFDMKPLDCTVIDLFRAIEKNRSRYAAITTVEDPNTTGSWLHGDGRWTGRGALFIVNP